MCEVNQRRSIRTDPSFDDMWEDGGIYLSMIEMFESLFPDQMRQAREDIETENPNPVRRTRRN